MAGSLFRLSMNEVAILAGHSTKATPTPSGLGLKGLLGLLSLRLPLSAGESLLGWWVLQGEIKEDEVLGTGLGARTGILGAWTQRGQVTLRSPKLRRP